MSRSKDFPERFDAICKKLLEAQDKQQIDSEWDYTKDMPLLMGFRKLGVIEKTDSGYYRLLDLDRLLKLREVPPAATVTEWTVFSRTGQQGFGVVTLREATQVMGRFILKSKNPPKTFSDMVYRLMRYLKQAEFHQDEDVGASS